MPASTDGPQQLRASTSDLNKARKQPTSTAPTVGASGSAGMIALRLASALVFAGYPITSMTESGQLGSSRTVRQRGPRKALCFAQYAELRLREPDIESLGRQRVEHRVVFKQYEPR